MLGEQITMALRSSNPSDAFQYVEPARDARIVRTEMTPPRCTICKRPSMELHEYGYTDDEAMNNRVRNFMRVCTHCEQMMADSLGRNGIR